MADELDDRLHDLAHDAEQLVVLAGPQAARSRGEKRRARRRATAAGTAVALALGVTGWQLLPRLEQADGTHTAPPAASGTASGTASASPTPAREALSERLLPANALPYAVKWQWKATDAAGLDEFPSQCEPPSPDGAVVEVTGQYVSEMVTGTAYERLLAYPDGPSATAAAEQLRERIAAKCGMDLVDVHDSVWGRLVAHRAMGSSKKFPGMTVWIQYEGQYVAVLVVDSPKSPLTWKPGDEPDGPRPAGCLADSLDDLALSTSPDVAATKGLPGDRHFTVGGAPTSNAYASGTGGTAPDKGAYSSTDDC
ncbi:hypothetical protein [Streptomyces sp. NPDC021020]|uniref:hypothetical protein n=1 Tax=Streptomyces sp. NPDC021020 TaxID=3365109 RepID=UPI00379B436B